MFINITAKNRKAYKVNGIVLKRNKMVNERKPDEFEDDRKKWSIYFDLESNTPGAGNVIAVRFRKNNIESPYLKKEDIERLKQDLQDLGKLRIIKQGRRFLGK